MRVNESGVRVALFGCRVSNAPSAGVKVGSWDVMIQSEKESPYFSPQSASFLLFAECAAVVSHLVLLPSPITRGPQDADPNLLWAKGALAPNVKVAVSPIGFQPINSQPGGAKCGSASSSASAPSPPS